MPNIQNIRSNLRRPVRGQAAELLTLLHRNRRTPLSKVDVLHEGRPALAFNLSKLLARLRRGGFLIEWRWAEGRDTRGRKVRFRRYWLQ
jgi:hypothetical protein